MFYCAVGEVPSSLTAGTAKSDYAVYFTDDCETCGDYCNGSCNQQQDCDAAATLGKAHESTCHKFCRTCKNTKDFLPNECFSCFLNAHLTLQNECICNNGFQGEADNCKPICEVDNCEACDFVAGRATHCLKCMPGYNNVNGKCEYCENHFDGLDEDCLPDPWIPYTLDYCQCLADEYYDTKENCCTKCPEGCSSCTGQSNGLITCDACFDGFRLADSSCYGRCPSNSVSRPVSGICENTAESFFNYNTGTTDTNPLLYTDNGITLYGGNNKTTEDFCDPFVSQDRGLWFDGMYSYATFEGLIVPANFELRMWIRAHGDGALFSSNRKVDDRSSEKFFALLIDNGKLTFADTASGVY